MAAYATATEVEEALGSPFTGDQAAVAARLVEAASDYVDRYTGRSWVAVTVTGEIQVARHGLVRLDRRPISTVTTVSKRGVYLGATPTTLTSPTGYEIINAAEGQLLVNATDGDIVTVTYATAPTVPDDIKQAVILLALSWLGGTINPSGQTYSKLKAGSVELTYRDNADAPVPPSVKAILDGYRPAINFA